MQKERTSRRRPRGLAAMGSERRRKIARKDGQIPGIRHCGTGEKVREDGKKGSTCDALREAGSTSRGNISRSYGNRRRFFVF